MVNLKVGGLILVAVIIIFGAVIIDDAIAPTVGEYSTLTNARNQSVTAAAAGSSIELLGQRGVGSLIVINASSGAVATSNFTLTEGIGSDGLLSTKLETKAGAVYASKAVNVSYQYEPDGYMHEQSDRSIFTLIILVTIIALVAFVLVGINVKDLFDM